MVYFTEIMNAFTFLEICVQLIYIILQELIIKLYVCAYSFKANNPFISWLLPDVLVDKNTVSLAHSTFVHNITVYSAV